MAALSEYSNVYNTALVVLQNKGFQLWFDRDANEYCAEKDGWDFRSSSPCGLLGVVTIYEATAPGSYREYWWKRDTPELHRKLPDQPPRPYVPVYLRTPSPPPSRS